MQNDIGHPRRGEKPEFKLRRYPPLDEPVNVKTAARFLGVSASLVYAWVERKQIPHYRMGRAIRFRIPELDEWRKQFHVNGGIE